MEWNKKVKLIISDVDETIAALYLRASSEMIVELEKLLSEGKVLFFISGQSIKNIQWRISDFIKPELRKSIIVGHCSGAEVWGFEENGNLMGAPFYSYYENALSESQKTEWRNITQEIIEEFHLKVYPTMPLSDFEKKSNKDPLAIMMEDRGPQITFEVVNAYNLPPEKAKELGVEIPMANGFYDLRIPILLRAEKLFIRNEIPVDPRIAGTFAIDFAIKGVSKTTAVKYVVENDSVLKSLGIEKNDLKNPENIEVWGDKFSVSQGGTDRHISEALSKQVRSIDFRQENPAEFPEGYNIVVWDGEHYLYEGLLEFLKVRNTLDNKIR